jgi:hypothetical protein
MKKDTKVKTDKIKVEATENKETPAITTTKNLTPKYPKLNFEDFYIDMEILNSTTGYVRFDSRIINEFYKFITTKSISTILRMERIGKNVSYYYGSYYHADKPVIFSGSIPFPTEIKESLSNPTYGSVSDVFIGYLLNETKSILNFMIERTDKYSIYDKISKSTFTDEYQSTIIQTAFAHCLKTENKEEASKYLLLQLILEAVLWKEYTGKDNLAFGDLIRDLAHSLSIKPKDDFIPNLESSTNNDDFDFEG